MWIKLILLAHLRAVSFRDISAGEYHYIFCSVVRDVLSSFLNVSCKVTRDSLNDILIGR